MILWEQAFFGNRVTEIQAGFSHNIDIIFQALRFQYFSSWLPLVVGPWTHQTLISRRKPFKMVTTNVQLDY